MTDHCSTLPDAKDVRWGFCQSEKYANARTLEGSVQTVQYVNT
jgi:hypothetical protein